MKKFLTFILVGFLSFFSFSLPGYSLDPELETVIETKIDRYIIRIKNIHPTAQERIDTVERLYKKVKRTITKMPVDTLYYEVLEFIADLLQVQLERLENEIQTPFNPDSPNYYISGGDQAESENDQQMSYGQYTTVYRTDVLQLKEFTRFVTEPYVQVTAGCEKDEVLLHGSCGFPRQTFNFQGGVIQSLFLGSYYGDVRGFAGEFNCAFSNLNGRPQQVKMQVLCSKKDYGIYVHEASSLTSRRYIDSEFSCPGEDILISGTCFAHNQNFIDVEQEQSRKISLSFTGYEYQGSRTYNEENSLRVPDTFRCLGANIHGKVLELEAQLICSKARKGMRIVERSQSSSSGDGNIVGGVCEEYEFPIASQCVVPNGLSDSLVAESEDLVTPEAFLTGNLFQKNSQGLLEPTCGFVQQQQGNSVRVESQTICVAKD